MIMDGTFIKVNYVIVKKLHVSETICNLAEACRTELWGRGT